MDWEKREKNILIIFGAGASYDIARGINGVPVTDGLFTQQHEVFNNALNQSPNRFAREIIDILDESLQVKPDEFSLERILFELLKRGESSIRTKKALLALRFFLRDLVRSYSQIVNNSTPSTNNYVRIARKLGQWQDQSSKGLSIVTFNYETLLDSALNDIFHLQLGNAETGIQEYIEHENISLFRPHGCVEWYREVDYLGSDLFSDRSIESLDLARYSISFRRNELTDGENDVPAIAIPFRERKEFEWPEAHKNKFLSVIPKTEKVFLIGWRAAEPHFIELIRDSLNVEAKWIIVAGSVEGAEEVRKNLESLKIRNTFRYDHGFTEFVNDPEFGRELEEII